MVCTSQDAALQYIVEHIEEPLLFERIQKHYKKFEQRPRLQFQALQALRKDGFRLQLIKDQLADCMTEDGPFSLEGFVRFRLYDYLAEMDKIIDLEAEKIISKNEYDDFIDLLKYFVYSQPAREQLVHIYPKANGDYALFNRDMENITDRSVAEFSTLGGTCDDVLISALIALAPNEIIIHGCLPNKELVCTIYKIFENHVAVK